MFVYFYNIGGFLMVSCALNLDIESNANNTVEVVYTCTKNLKYIEEYGMLFIYGIKCYVDLDTSMDDPYNCCIIDDISNDKELVTDLITKLESNKVLPIHIPDIVMDTIC